MNTLEKARRFVYRCARPIDLARWQYHFENGSQEAVLTALAAYQNEDGGFGHALEADSFNPNSCPIQTNTAVEILREIGMTDPKHPIVQGILRYLDSGADFDEAHRQWLNTVPSNNDYPCAVWWKYGDKGSSFKYNPTASLAGFGIRFAAPDSAFHKRCCDIAREAVDWLLAQEPFTEQHVAACFVRLYEDCAEAGKAPFDMIALRERLGSMIRQTLDGVAEKWGKEYASMPSDLITSRSCHFYAANAAVVAAQCDYIRHSQLPDGSFIVPWQWWTDDKGFDLAENWWKSDIAVKFMRHLREFDDLTQGG